MSEDRGYNLVLSNDRNNTASNMVTVLPRTSSARFVWGGVASPRDDGGCDRPGIIDCCQPYTIFAAGRADRLEASQLIEPIGDGKSAIARTMLAVEASLRVYLGVTGAGFLAQLLRRRAPAKAMIVGQGDVVLVGLGNAELVECVVVSNTNMNRFRPLPLVSVVPTVDVAFATGMPDPIVLLPHEDGVTRSRVALPERPYTIDLDIHVRESRGRVRTQPTLGDILSALGLHLSIESMQGEFN